MLPKLPEVKAKAPTALVLAVLDDAPPRPPFAKIVAVVLNQVSPPAPPAELLPTPPAPIETV